MTDTDSVIFSGQAGAFDHRNRRIGLLGGSFNPAHAGHLHISRMALKLLRLDEVWWLVSPQNPLKSTDGMATFEKRMDAARAVATAVPRIHVSDVEAQLGTRYTADTLEKLVPGSPSNRFVWLMGADNLAGFHRWNAWRSIAARVPIAVIDRPGSRHAALSSLAAQALAGRRIDGEDSALLPYLRPPVWALVRGPLSPLSSTALRRLARVEEGGVLKP